jgi:hypothetical protein
MSDAEFLDIWSPETGIEDLPADIAALAVPEIARVKEQWSARKAELGDSDRLRLFTEQLNREWAIETGIIENLYDIERGVTQTLIEQGFQAALLEHGSVNKDPQYVLRLIEDQKAALENLFAFVKHDRELTTGYVKELHAMMTQSQTTADSVDPSGRKVQVELLHGEWKKWPNYPVKDGVELRYCPPEQTASEMDRLLEMHARHPVAGVPPEVEAAWLHHRFTQIHPFQDGNGRVARALASLVLIRAGLFPLVVPREEKTIYLESLEKADNGNLRSLVVLVSRRQEVAHRRAINLIEKLAPAAESMTDAASMVGHAYAKRRGVIDQRLEKRLGLLSSFVESELGDQARLAQRNLREAAGFHDASDTALGGGFPSGARGRAEGEPSIEVSGLTTDDNYLEAVRSIAIDRWGAIPGRPCGWLEVTVRLDRDFRLLVHIHALNPETNDSMQAAGMALGSAGLAPLDVEPLTWGADESIAVLVLRLKSWAQKFLRAGLDFVRRQM